MLWTKIVWEPFVHNIRHHCSITKMNWLVGEKVLLSAYSLCSMG